MANQSQLLKARICAICGRGQSGRLGGIGCYATMLQAYLADGGKLKVPASGYAHVKCASSTRRKVR